MDLRVAAVLATAAGSGLLSKVGTAVYMAPERGNEQAYGSKADMWATGCVLIEVATGMRLTRGLNVECGVSVRLGISGRFCFLSLSLSLHLIYFALLSSCLHGVSIEQMYVVNPRK